MVSTSATRRTLIHNFALLLGLALGLAMPSVGHAQTPGSKAPGSEVPGKAEVGSLVVNYTRLRPTIATGGLVQNGAVPQLKALGFATIIDLRGPEEGIAAEKQAAEAAGLRYVNIPVTAGAPADDQITEFARVVEDDANAPVLVHCASANRVGTLWALYRARKGTPLAMAIGEGRVIGMQPAREAEVRRRVAAWSATPQ